MKLKDLKLIDASYIDERIRILDLVIPKYVENDDYDVEIAERQVLRDIKNKLVNSEKLAELAFDKGRSTGYTGYSEGSTFMIVEKEMFLESNVDLT